MQKDAAEYNHLLVRLKLRDLTAFNELYKTSRNRLLVLAFYITDNEEAAKDLVQEFFIDLWEKTLYNNIEGSLKNYLIASIRNRAINYQKKQGTINALKSHLQPGSEKPIVYDIENEELKTKIEFAIQQLPPMASKVFRLHYQEHLSHKEISRMLQISTSTVSSHIDRALKELREVLKG
jgi:RNA polymerase sigma-70 factor (family 1)